MNNSLNTISSCDDSLYADALRWMDDLINSVCDDGVQPHVQHNVAVEIELLCLQRMGQDSSFLTDRQISDRLVEIMWREHRQLADRQSTEDEYLQVHMYILAALLHLSPDERNRALNSAHPEQDRLLHQLTPCCTAPGKWVASSLCVNGWGIKETMA